MLVNLAQKLLPKIIRNEDRIRILLLVLAPFLLLFPPNEYDFDTDGFLYGKQDVSFRLLSNKPLDFEKLPPHETICIVLDKENKNNQFIKEMVKYLSLRTRTVLITEQDIKELFFLNLYIKFDSCESVKLHPFRNFQPNLDLLTLAIKHFGATNTFSFKDLFGRAFDNSINIFLKDELSSYIKLLKILRYCMNVDSFKRVNYYYIPLASGFIKAEPFCLFVVAMIIVMSFDLTFTLDPLKLVCISFLYYIFPPSFMFLYESRDMALYTIVFCAINFKFAFLFCLLRCLYMMYIEASKYLTNQKSKIKSQLHKES